MPLNVLRQYEQRRFTVKNNHGENDMKPDTIFLFQGDSITDGNRLKNGDPNHILGHGYVFCTASKLAEEYAGQHPYFFNRGVSGDRTSQILDRWQEDALALHPDVLTLLAGVNNILSCYSKEEGQLVSSEELAQRYEEDIRKMLTASRKQNPSLKILLGLPFFYKADCWSEAFHKHTPAAEKEFTMDFRSIIQHNAEEKMADAVRLQQITRRIAADFQAQVLDFPAAIAAALEKAPLDYWVWDGIHPTYAGHRLLAKVWLEGWEKIRA